MVFVNLRMHVSTFILTEQDSGEAGFQASALRANRRSHRHATEGAAETQKPKQNYGRTLAGGLLFRLTLSTEQIVLYKQSF